MLTIYVYVPDTLVGVGLLDNRPHTSNGPGFLEMLAPAYSRQRS